MIVGGVILALAGLVVIGVSVRGWQGRLSRNYVAGVRTPSTMRSDAAFRVGNKVAAPFGVAGGAVMAIGGAVGAALPARDGAPAVLIVTCVAVVLVVIGGILGARAARATP